MLALSSIWMPKKLLAEELDKTRREMEARRIARSGDTEGSE
jgi:heme exporter protein D